MNAVYQEGRMAYADEVPLSENPYAHDTEEWQSWRDGWFDAQAAA